MQKDGQVQLWKFLQQSYVWEKVDEAALCGASDSQVLSACLLEEQCVVYWCESSLIPPNTNCTVYRRDLNTGNLEAILCLSHYLYFDTTREDL